MRINPVSFVDLSTSWGTMRTHLFRPIAPGGSESRTFPGIILFSEIYQMTGPIARTAATIAGKGFMVAVPEVYHEFEPPGTVLPYDKPGTVRGNELKIRKELASYDADAIAVIEYLLQDSVCSGELGTIGICLGGHLAFRAAMSPKIKACACLYATDIHKSSLGLGMQDDTLTRIPEINAELLMIWGRQDPHIPNEGRRLIYEALHQAGRTFTWHEFNGEHAFLRDEGHRFDSELVSLVHALVDSLFNRCLKR